MSDELTLYRHASGRLYCEGMTCMHGECERRKDVGLGAKVWFGLSFGFGLTFDYWIMGLIKNNNNDNK